MMACDKRLAMASKVNAKEKYNNLPEGKKIY